MHGEEIRRVAKLVDEPQLMIDLVVIGFRQAMGKHLLGCCISQRCQRLLRGAAFHHLLIGILILDLAQVESALVGNICAGLYGVGKGGEAPLHLVRRFEVAIHIALAPEPQPIDGGPLADGGHDILQRPGFGRMIENIAGSDTAHPRLPRHGVKPVQTGKVIRAPAEREGHIGAAAKDIAKTGKIGERLAVGPVRHQDGDHAFGMVRDISPVEQATAFATTCLTERKQAGQARPGGPVGRIKKQSAAVGQVNARASDHPDLGSLLRLPSPHHPGNAAPIGKAERFVTQQGSGGEQLLGRGGAAQEGEVAGYLQLDIAGHQPNIPCMYQLRSPVCSSTPSPRRNSQKRSPPCASTRK